MNKTILMMILVVLLSSLACPVHAPFMVHEYNLDIPCYKSARITFNYAATLNTTVYDIGTLGNGVFTYTGGPSFFEFRAESVDDYYFTLRIQYDGPINQTVLIGIFSGSLPVQGLDLKSLFEDIQIHVRLRVSEQPTFPTESEVANAVVAKVEGDLANYYRAIETAMTQQNLTLVTVSILAVMALVMSAVMAIIHLYELRKLRMNVPRVR